jgi:hypothetical protein
MSRKSFLRSKRSRSAIGEVHAESPTHRICDESEILFWNAQEAETKGSPPVLFVLNKCQSVYERSDRSIGRQEILDFSTKWMKSLILLNLKHFAVPHPANGSECLQLLPLWVVSLRGIISKPISWPHTLERPFLTMIQLRDTISETNLHVVFRRNTDPILS